MATEAPPRRDELLVVRGTRVHLLAAGAGEPVLYLHGAGVSNAWLPFHRHLAARCQLYAPDLLGFGQSERPEWLDTVQDYAVHVLDLLDALALPRVHLVGHSLGGWIAAELASWAAHRLASLTLIDAAGLYLPGYEVPDLFVLSYPEVVRLMYHDPAVAERVLAVPDTPERAAERLRGSVTLARVGWNPYLYCPKLMQRLHRIQTPTLLLWGAEDRVFPVAMAEAWQAALPNATLELVSACGHSPPIEQPERSAAAVAVFVERHAGRT